MSDLLDKKSSGISSEQKKKFMKIAAVAGVLLLLWGLFHITGQKNKLPQAEAVEKPLDLGVGLVEDDLYERLDTYINKEEENKVTLAKQLEEQQRKQEELQKMLETELKRVQESGYNSPLANSQSPIEYPEPVANASFPEPPKASVNKKTPQANPNPGAEFSYDPAASEGITDTWLGGLNHQKFVPVQKKKEQKAPLKFYQPPSFFDAKLLTGIDAVTSKGAKSDPEQVFLMITAPAVLPNHIKANLKGCFVVANATGHLGKERVQLQVVNLSCVSADGSAVIDQDVLGFVADKDGKRDLAGNVVAKNSTHMAWLMAASAIGAVGNSVQVQSVNQQSSALGTVNTFNSDKLGERALGASLKEGSEDFKEIILEYIRQSAPVVEIGAMKDATVFIQQGVWLQIMDRFASEVQSK